MTATVKADITKIKSNEPAIIIAIGDLSCQIYICAERIIVCECQTFIEAVKNLISVYFVFDMAYSRTDYPTLLFLQRYILCIQDSQPIPPSLVRVMSLLDNNN